MIALRRRGQIDYAGGKCAACALKLIGTLGGTAAGAELQESGANKVLNIATMPVLLVR